MRLLPAIPAGVLGAVLLLAAGCAAPEVAGFSPVKANLCADCRRETLSPVLPAENLPERGVVLAYGRQGWPFVDWTVVDLDKRSITAIETEAYPDGAGGNRIEASELDSAHLAPDEIQAIVAAANLAWNPPATARPAAAAASDATAVWSLYLIDYGAIWRDGGNGAIAAYVRPLEQAIDAVHKRRPIQLPN